LTDEENVRLQKNHTDMVSSGQNKSTVIFYKGKEAAIGDAMADLVNELSLLAKTLDGETGTYTNALKSITTSKNQSAAILSSLTDSKDFHDIALEKSIQNTQELRQNKSLDLNYLELESEESLKRFKEIEDNPQKNIEAYVEQYNSQI
jgi:gamma-glutamyl:cysteine ligase YbdK (ATP-grasp superfamily)